MNISTGTIVRSLCLLVALINQVLVMSGVSPLPVEDEQINELISTIATISTALWAWWKNNSFTDKAIKADEYMKSLK